jgi:hypothetical protein
MESTGAPGRIHLSQEVVDLLLDAGKSHWVITREDKVHAKGKGVLNTVSYPPNFFLHDEDIPNFETQHVLFFSFSFFLSI